MTMDPTMRRARPVVVPVVRGMRLPETLQPDDGELLVAIMHSPGDVRFVATARDWQALIARVAAYVGQRLSGSLWPDDSTAVRRRLVAGDRRGAIERYLEAVDTRWDRESLTVAIAPIDGGGGEAK